jgi:hypothetical protein
MVAVRSGRSAFTILLIDWPGPGLRLPGARERGEHDREVRFDAVAQPVEDRAVGQVGLGHPE